MSRQPSHSLAQVARFVLLLSRSAYPRRTEVLLLGPEVDNRGVTK